MSYGIIEYNIKGLPKCEICNKHFHRVLTHVRQRHNMTEREYKQTYGFDLKKGITSQESKLKSREAAIKNYEQVIYENLLQCGIKPRFTVGSPGRDRSMVSEQTRLMLKNNLKKPEMIEAMRESGRKLGLSGKGNQKRWGQ